MKKLLIIGLPLLLVGGGGTVFTLGKLGIVSIPGITPPKKVAKPSKEKEPEPVAKKPKKNPEPPRIEARVAPAAPKSDPSLGNEKLAQLWNEMEVGVLLSVTSGWSEAELAPVLEQMDNSKVAEFITAVAAKSAERADRLTKAIQSEASKI